MPCFRVSYDFIIRGGRANSKGKIRDRRTKFDKMYLCCAHERVSFWGEHFGGIPDDGGGMPGVGRNCLGAGLVLEGGFGLRASASRGGGAAPGGIFRGVRAYFGPVSMLSAPLVCLRSNQYAKSLHFPPERGAADAQKPGRLGAASAALAQGE